MVTFRQLLVSSKKRLDGKIFVEFIALLLISYLNQKMKGTDLYKNYTMLQLWDKNDVIECLEALGVEVPNFFTAKQISRNSLLSLDKFQNREIIIYSHILSCIFENPNAFPGAIS